jgi:hypothetical protein
MRSTAVEIMPVETIPVETMPVETMPVETMPVETMALEDVYSRVKRTIVTAVGWRGNGGPYGVVA